jgi:copper chaperone CopZ
MEETNIAIEGMSCGACVRRVQNALQVIPGVQVEAVSVGSATVRYDASLVSPATLTQAIRNAGYEAHVGRLPMMAGAKRTSGGCCG